MGVEGRICEGGGVKVKTNWPKWFGLLIIYYLIKSKFDLEITWSEGASVGIALALIAKEVG